jgi:hypothetical protein
MVCEIDGELFPPMSGSISGSAVKFLMDEDEARRWDAAEELTRAQWEKSLRRGRRSPLGV